MKRKLLLLLGLILLGNSLAQEMTGEDKTLSPYFFVKSDDPNLDQLPLKSTSAEVNIAGVIAEVKVTQVYKNEGQKPLEAVYVFPASTRAAVYGMKMTIGDRTLVAKIGKREEARREYEKALEEGKSASLLEQQRPNVFQMNVGNLLPGDEIKVELSYTELLVPTDGVYEFVYPTVVGPRYSNQPEATAPANDKWVKNPYFKQGEAPSYTFDLTTNLAAGMPIQEISCASHKVNVNYDDPARATIKLDDSEKSGGNRDYILKYRLAGGQIASGLLTYQHQDENFFLLMVQPPQRVAANQIPPREFVFIVDVSGSMHGFPLEVSKKLLRNLIGGLRPNDKFNVILFAGSASVMSEESLPATSDNIQRAIRVIDEQQGGGGTELLPALQRALALPRALGSSRTVVIATDGYVNVEAGAFDLVRQKLGEANMFAFGIGSSVNRHLIEGMARAGMGEPFIVTNADEASGEAEKFRRYIQTPVLTRVRIDFGEFSAYAIEPPAVPDVLAERPVIVFGKWRGALTNGQARAAIKLSGVTGEQAYTANINLSEAQSSPANSALRYLWARHRIAVLSDYNGLHNDADRVNEVTNLGLQYNLLTAYTSFVAVDSKVRKIDGQITRVEQPLPLPQGVSDYAVGGAQSLAFNSLAPARLHMRKATSGAGAPQSIPDYSSELLRSQEKVEKDNEAGQNLIGKIKVNKIVVTGAATEAAVQVAIKRHMQELQACYQQALLMRPGLRGKLVLQLTFDARGFVTALQLVPDGLQDKNLASCITPGMKAWRFDGVKGGGTATVTLEFAP